MYFIEDGIASFEYLVVSIVNGGHETKCMCWSFSDAAEICDALNKANGYVYTPAINPHPPSTEK
jgi:hypothetical protein